MKRNYKNVTNSATRSFASSRYYLELGSNQETQKLFLEHFKYVAVPKLVSKQDERFNPHLVYPFTKKDLIALLTNNPAMTDFSIYRKDRSGIIIKADQDILSRVSQAS